MPEITCLTAQSNPADTAEKTSQFPKSIPYIEYAEKIYKLSKKIIDNLISSPIEDSLIDDLLEQLKPNKELLGCDNFDFILKKLTPKYFISSSDLKKYRENLYNKPTDFTYKDYDDAVVFTEEYKKIQSQLDCSNPHHEHQKHDVTDTKKLFDDFINNPVNIKKYEQSLKTIESADNFFNDPRNLNKLGILRTHLEIKRLEIIRLTKYSEIDNILTGKKEELIDLNTFFSLYLYSTNFGFQFNRELRFGHDYGHKSMIDQIHKGIERLSSFSEFQLDTEQDVLTRFVTLPEDILEKIIKNIASMNNYLDSAFTSTSFKNITSIHLLSDLNGNPPAKPNKIYLYKEDDNMLSYTVLSNNDQINTGKITLSELPGVSFEQFNSLNNKKISSFKPLEFKILKIIQDRAHITKDIGAAEFSQNANLEIRIKLNGKRAQVHGCKIDGISPFPEEGEFLFCPGTRFECHAENAIIYDDNRKLWAVNVCATNFKQVALKVNTLLQAKDNWISLIKSRQTSDGTIETTPAESVQQTVPEIKLEQYLVATKQKLIPEPVSLPQVSSPLVRISSFAGSRDINPLPPAGTRQRASSVAVLHYSTAAALRTYNRRNTIAGDTTKEHTVISTKLPGLN